jgi:hypothetical protein
MTTKPAMTDAQRQALCRSRKAEAAEYRYGALVQIKNEARTIKEAREIATKALEQTQ